MWMNIGRRGATEVPLGICLRCFNTQQRNRFPYSVYCSHNQVLAVLRSPSDFQTIECSPDQYRKLADKLANSAT